MASGFVGRWQTLRERWFIARSAGGITLILLWPLGLLFPTPVPLVADQGLSDAREALAALVEGQRRPGLARPVDGGHAQPATTRGLGRSDPP